MDESSVSPTRLEGHSSRVAGFRDGRRVLIVCLTLLVIYLAVVSVGLLIRWELHRWGLILAHWQFSALRLALWFHVGLAAVLGLLIVLARRRSHIALWWSRAVLASAGPLLLVSADRIASVGYRPIKPRTEIMMPHPTRYWTFRPGWVRTDGHATYRINEHGLRGPLIPYEKRAGEYRLLFLGDSIAFGQGVDDGDGFVRRIETMAASGGYPHLSVINASVTGYSPWQEYDLLKEQGLRYDPDAIVQVFCLNDVGQKFRLVKYGGRTKHLAPPEPSALEWSGLFRMSRALTFQWFGPTRAELNARETDYAPEAVIDHFDAPRIQEALRVTGENLARIISLARDIGRPIAIVCFPTGRQIDMPEDTWSRPQDWLAALCRRHDVPFLDLTQVYRQYARTRGLSGNHLFPDDIHPNQLAHRIAAEEIYAFLLGQGWLGPTP